MKNISKKMVSEQAMPEHFSQFADPEHYKKLSQRILSLAKKASCDAAELVFSTGVGLQLTVRMGEIDTLEFNRDKGCAITVYKGKQKGSVSTSELSSDSLEKAVTMAAQLASLTEADPWSGLAEKADLATNIQDLALYHPWAIEVEEAIEIAKKTEDLARQQDARIINSEGASFSTRQDYFIYANSHGFMGGYPTSQHSLSCVLIGQDKNKENMERDYEYTSARSAQELEDPSWVASQAALKTVARLNARRIPTQVAPVLFKSEVASGLLGKFIAGISGGRLYRKTSFLLDSLGEQVFPAWFEMRESPFIIGGNGSCPFDNEGVLPKDRFLVEAGKVQGYVLSSYSARRLGMSNTGNAGGVHNLLVKTGSQDLEDLIKHMGRGLLVTELMGSGINLVTGDYSRGASGFWVENGAIQFPVHELTIAGNLKDMFRNIVAIGQDIDKRSNILTGSILIDKMTIAGC
jgi:PmbA protein